MYYTHTWIGKYEIRGGDSGEKIDRRGPLKYPKITNDKHVLEWVVSTRLAELAMTMTRTQNI